MAKNKYKYPCVLLTLLYVQIVQILGSGMSTKMWEASVEHAKTCVLTDKVHHYYPDGLNKAGVVFNTADIKAAAHDLPDGDVPKLHDPFHDAFFCRGSFCIGFDINRFIDLTNTERL